MAKLRRDHVMVAREMVARDVSVREAAAHFGVDESTLRYHLARAPEGLDGRADRASALDGWEERVLAVLTRFGDARVTPGATTRCQAQQVFGVLQREHGFAGSYQAVRRYLHRLRGAPDPGGTPGGAAAGHPGPA
jgi:transposase